MNVRSEMTGEGIEARHWFTLTMREWMHLPYRVRGYILATGRCDVTLKFVMFWRW